MLDWPPRRELSPVAGGVAPQSAGSGPGLLLGSGVHSDKFMK